ncbi:PGN_0703 family putative restriction endonuclease [Arenimonas metalli]|uniref:PGN_0703 family putative restriction endonuclease n=1 Tax=Arenimonas metalli TaxID=948077 RepID=UPI0012EB5809|nr:hypothetical protein [Arenimonas metalli]
MTFRDQACAHLCGYRKNNLGLAEEGVFVHRRIPHHKGHILPKGSEQRNLLEGYRDLFFASEYGATDRHRYFHHLNSSQGLCFNLFFPLIHEKQLPLLVRSIGSDMSHPAEARFEFPSPREIAKRRTSFDFYLRGSDRESYVEVKYTEDGFGRAKQDPEHLEKFRNTYAPLLKDSAYLADECNDPTFFLKNYQVLRNLVHITPTSEVVFLFPRANRKVAEQAECARERFLTDAGRERMRIVFLEDLVGELITACRGTLLGRHYESFHDKYLAFA